MKTSTLSKIEALLQFANSVEDIMVLNKMVAKRWRALNAASAAKLSSRLEVGQRVGFKGTDGKTVKAKVEKVNRTTVQVVEKNGTQWSLAMSALIL